MEITLYINNRKYQLHQDADVILLDVLRELGYKSVKRGCDKGICGVCSIIMNNKLVPSCSLYATNCQNAKIFTIEGLKEETKDIAEFMNKEGAVQCGYCTPSLLLSIYSLQKEFRNPTDEEIKHYLVGNFCRCTGYEGNLRAIKKYFESKNN